MNFDGNFRRIGSANVEAARALVTKLSEESWYQDTNAAEESSGEAGCQRILLVHDDRIRHDQPTKQPALEVFGNAIRQILAVAADFYDSSELGQQLSERNGAGYFVRASLIRISGGCSLAMKEEVNFSETHAHRIHVPIITNPNTGFTVANETLTIPDGEIFEINNKCKGSIKNTDDSACVHLVLDYVLKGEMCCCGSRQHPEERCSPEACFASDRATQSCTCFAGDDH